MNGAENDQNITVLGVFEQSPAGKTGLYIAKGSILTKE